MIVPPVVENRLDIFGEPAVPRPLESGGVTVVVREGVCLLKPGALTSFRRKGVDHVAHHRIVDAVTHEDDGELAEQFGDEPCCPLFGQIRPAEIGSRED